jgi:hypothetical protein
MQDFGRVLRSFERSDTHFKTEINAAAARAAGMKAQRLRVEQIANAQAYYVLLWAQFESALHSRVASLATRGQNAGSNRSRRVWKLVAKRHSDDRLNVMEQVELLADKGGTTYNAIQQYRLRNDFAHGQFQRTPIDLRLIAADLARLFGSLRVGR